MTEKESPTTDKPDEGNETNDGLKNEVDVLKGHLDYIKDYLPKATISGPTGEITTSDKFGYFVEPVAYASAKKAASAINERIQEKVKGLGKDSKILIVDHLDAAKNDLVYIELLIQFRIFDAALKAQIDKNTQIIKGIEEQQPLPKRALPIGAALLAAPYAVNAFAEMASYFRTDYKGFGREFSVKTEAFLAAVAGELIKTPASSHQLYLYNNYLLEIPSLITYEEAKKNHLDLNRLSLLEAVTFYCDLVNTAATSSTTLKLLVEEHKDAKDTDLKKYLAKASEAVSDTDTILKAAGEFFKGVSTVETGQTQSKMGSAILRDGIRRLGITHLLSITIPSSGGDTITERRFWGNKNKYIGGLVISFVLASVRGEILMADTVSYYGVMNYRLGLIEPDEFICRELKGE